MRCFRYERVGQTHAPQISGKTFRITKHLAENNLKDSTFCSTLTLQISNSREELLYPFSLVFYNRFRLVYARLRSSFGFKMLTPFIFYLYILSSSRFFNTDSLCRDGYRSRISFLLARCFDVFWYAYGRLFKLFLG